MELTERNVLLILHVATAIMFIGPVTVATSVFPRFSTRETLPVAREFYRISRGYGFGSLAVIALGLILAQRTDYLGQGWVNASLAIFILAYGLLLGFIVPRQRRLLAALDAGTDVTPADLAPLRATSGVFGLAWVVILYLMVAKPF